MFGEETGVFFHIGKTADPIAFFLVARGPCGPAGIRASAMKTPPLTRPRHGSRLQSGAGVSRDWIDKRRGFRQKPAQ